MTLARHGWNWYHKRRNALPLYGICAAGIVIGVTITTIHAGPLTARMINQRRLRLTNRLQKIFRQRSSRKRLVRYGLITANVLVLGAVAGFVMTSSSSDHMNASAGVLADQGDTTNPVDGLTAYDIAARVAEITNLPEQSDIKNQQQSAQIDAVVSANGASLVTKPQIVATALKSKDDIATYVVQSGDTITSIAQGFGITSDSVRWSNNLTGNKVSAGMQLVIPPINGIVYTAQAGDSIQNLATKFVANADQIVAYNDAEIKGISAGERLLIPNGQIRITTNNYGLWGFSPAYGGNGYVPGQCTWWAANRRIQIGRPVPSNLGNANTWLQGAALAGFSEGHVPQAGAVIWFQPRVQTSAYLGHVAYVESVDADGTVHASDMNWSGGPFSVRHFTMTPDEASEYWYIY